MPKQTTQPKWTKRDTKVMSQILALGFGMAALAGILILFQPAPTPDEPTVPENTEEQVDTPGTETGTPEAETVTDEVDTETALPEGGTEVDETVAPEGATPTGEELPTVGE